MKNLIASLAVLSLLGAAAPALASDVVEFRYSPSRERVQNPPATEKTAKPEGAAEPAKAPCACCAKGGGHEHAQHEKAST